MKKFGLLCLAVILALGALGVGYAAWTDTIAIDGTVNTGSVEITIVDTSNTWVWKIVGNEDYPDEVCIIHDLDSNPAPLPYGSYTELIAYADAEKTSDDTITVTIDNAFPLDGVTDQCNYFCADAILQYTGSIPVIATATLTGWDGSGAPYLSDMAEVYFYELELVNDEWISGNAITGPVQLHEDDYVLAVFCLDVPQNSFYMNMTGSFAATLDVIQWNEY